MSEFHAKLRETRIRAICPSCDMPNCATYSPKPSCLEVAEMQIDAEDRAIADCGAQIVPDELPKAIAKEAMSDAIANGDIDNNEQFQPDANAFWQTALERLQQAAAKEEADD